MKLIDRSAKPVYNRKFPPVFRFYASLPRTSLLQGNASAGAKWLSQFFIFEVAGCTNFVLKPDCNAKPVSEESRFIGTDLEWKAGLKLPSTQNCSFPNHNKYITYIWSGILSVGNLQFYTLDK